MRLELGLTLELRLRRDSVVIKFGILFGVRVRVVFKWYLRLDKLGLRLWLVVVGVGLKVGVAVMVGPESNMTPGRTMYRPPWIHHGRALDLEPSVGGSWGCGLELEKIRKNL